MADDRLLINVLGNSLAIPSPKQGLYYRGTYAALVAAGLGAGAVVVNRARRNMTVVDQTRDINVEDDIVHIRADYHIIHLGIVDCAPRLFTTQEQKLMKFLPLSRVIIRWASRHRRFLTRKIPKVYVRREVFDERFRRLLDVIHESTPSRKTFIINIAATKERNIQRSFGIERNIANYNAVLRDVVRDAPGDAVLIDFHEKTVSNPSFVAEDGIHVTPDGHRWLAAELVRLIKECEVAQTACPVA